MLLSQRMMQHNTTQTYQYQSHFSSETGLTRCPLIFFLQMCGPVHPRGINQKCSLGLSFFTSSYNVFVGHLLSLITPVSTISISLNFTFHMQKSSQAATFHNHQNDCF